MISQEHKELLSTQSESKTLPEWVDFFEGQYTKKQIYSYCYHHNYRIKKLSQEEKSKIQSQNARKWHINQDYFKTWSHNMAYMFGFWCADGCIYGGKMFDITTHTKDKYIIKKFAQELAYEGNITDYVDRQACRLNFSCVVIYNDLIKLGGKEHKSMDLPFPQVPKQYLPDFIRGYFDGDGCVMNLKNHRLNTAFTSGSYKFLQSLWNILKIEAGVLGGSYDKSSMSLRFGKRDSIKIGQYMYQGNPELYLERKYKKFILQEDKNR